RTSQAADGRRPRNQKPAARRRRKRSSSGDSRKLGIASGDFGSDGAAEMKFVHFLLLCAIAYTASGFYVVRGNERAAVRRFGRAERTPEGKLQLASAGLHYALPWPFAQVDRIRVNEARTLNIGI